MSFGHVYILQVEDQNLFKIGKTNVSVQERVKALQTGCPYTLTVYKTIPTYWPEKLEKIIHTMMRNEKKRGEWFAVTPEEMDNVLDAPDMSGLTDNPFDLDGDPMNGVTITPRAWTRDRDGRVHVSPRCIVRSELEYEVYRLVYGLLRLLDAYTDPYELRKQRAQS